MNHLKSPIPTVFQHYGNCLFGTQVLAPQTWTQWISCLQYSGGSNTEQVRISNVQACSVYGPDHLKTELQNGRSSLDRFIQKSFFL